MGRYRVGFGLGWVSLLLGLAGCTSGTKDPPAVLATFDGAYPIEVTCTTVWWPTWCGRWVVRKFG